MVQAPIPSLKLIDQLDYYTSCDEEHRLNMCRLSRKLKQVRSLFINYIMSDKTERRGEYIVLCSIELQNSNMYKIF